MSRSGRKSTVNTGRGITDKNQVKTGAGEDEFSDGEGLSRGEGATKSSSYTSPPSKSRKWEPQESTLASSIENSRKNDELKTRIGDIEAELSELKQELNLEESSSGFISQYAAWRRENSLYIDVILVVVVAVMAFYIIAGMFSGSSPVPDRRPVPGTDKTCKEEIQALESRFDGEIQDLKHDLNSDISNFRNNEFASISSEFDFIKGEYEGLKSNTEHRMNEVQTNMASLTEGNDEFKTKQNQALEDFKTQQAETLEQSKTQLESDQKTFKENLEKSIREEQSRRIQEIEDGIGDKVNEKIDGKSDNLTRHIVAIVFEREEFVKIAGASESTEEKVHTLSEKVQHQEIKTQSLNEANMAFDGRLTKVEQNLSASIKSTKDECMEEIKKVNNDTVQNLTDSVKGIGGEVGNVRDLVQNVNETLVEKIINIDEEIQTLHIQMREKITSYDSQLDKIQEMLNKLSQETAGRLGDIQGGIDGLTDWKKEIETWQHQSEGKMHVLHEQGYDTNTIVILVVVIIVFIVILVVMIMMRQMNLAVQNAVGRSQTMQAGQDPASRLLKTVQRDCAEEKTVCILYFSKQSKQFCVNLTKTVEPDTKKLRQCFLYSDSDIKTIPRSKVIIVYVEKNERNVILEDPDQELGNLRRTTVEAARIMGATVVVVYMHHDESRNLGKEELYCSALYSVTRHYVLSELEKEGAVLSVYDSFSDFQQKHLKELISKNV